MIDAQMEDCFTALQANARHFLENLKCSWSSVGFDSQVVKERFDVVVTQFSHLGKAMLEEAAEEKQQMMQAIEELMHQKKVLKNELKIEVDVDSVSCENMPLYQIKLQLEDDLRAYEHLITDRKARIQEYVEKQRLLCTAMGLPERHLAPVPIPTENQLSAFQQYLDQLSTKKFTLEEEFIEAKMEIGRLTQELGLKDLSEFHERLLCQSDSEFVLSEGNMKSLRDLHASLAHQAKALAGDIDKCWSQLNMLWNYIGKPEEYCRAFRQKHSSTEAQTLAALQQEVAACEAFKWAHVEKFVGKLQQGIAELWDICYVGKKERQAFCASVRPDRQLQQHEEELARLHQRASDFGQLFDLLDERSKLLQQKAAFDRKENNPDRFKNRGGALLREAKERRALEVRLPRVQESLRKLAEGQRESVLLINDVPLEAFIEEGWSSEQRPLLRKPLTPAPSKLQLGQSLYKRNAGTTPRPQPIHTAATNSGRSSTKKPVQARRNILGPRQLHAPPQSATSKIIGGGIVKSRKSLHISRQRAAIIRSKRVDEVLQYVEFKDLVSSTVIHK